MLERPGALVPGSVRATGRAGTVAVDRAGAGDGFRFEALSGRGPADEEDALSPVRLLWHLIQYRWLIAVLVAAGLVLGAVVTLMQTPRFLAEARIEIMVPTARVLQDLDIVTQTGDVRAFETARQKLRSRDLARRVVLELNLAQNAAYVLPRPDFSVVNIFDRIFGGDSRPRLADLDAETREILAVERLLENLSVTLVRGTSLISVGYSDPDPELAAAITNQVVRSYMDQQVDRTVETSDLARQFIEEQVAEVKSKLEQSESALVAYANQAGLSSAGDDGSLVSANIEALNAALSGAIQERLAAERLVAQLDSGAAEHMPQVLDDEAVKATRSAIAELQAEYQHNLGTYKPGFPEMRQLQARIDELERQRAAQVDEIAASIRVQHREAVQQEADLRAELADLESRQVAFQDKNIQYTILRREVESNRAQYQSLIDKLNEVGVVSDLRSANVDVVDYAVVPAAPYAPKLSTNLIVYFSLSGLLAAAIIYLSELLNNKFNVPDQIENELKLPVLGIIPRVEGEALGGALTNPKSALAEAYRSLRTSLQFAGPEGAPRSLLLASAEPGETKSTCAYKLADEFGAIGVRVLIIDADLRRPSLHRIFRTDNSIGLSNLLTSSIANEDIARVFRRTELDNVTFLSAGPMVPNPADLLSSHRMSAIVHACTKRFDLVLVDTPPVIGLADALILSRLTEATMLIVAAHQAPRKSVKAALKRLSSAGGHIIGATMAKLDVEKVESNYAYRYMYDGYYSYGHGQAGETGAIEDKVTDHSNVGVRGMAIGRSVARLYDRHLRRRLQRS